MIKKEKIKKYKYDKASDYIRIELKNLLLGDIRQKILFQVENKKNIINQIHQELTNSIWNDIQEIKDSNIISSSIIRAIINKDATTIYEICKSNTKKYYLRWILKRIISKILNII